MPMNVDTRAQYSHCTRNVLVAQRQECLPSSPDTVSDVTELRRALRTKSCNKKPTDLEIRNELLVDMRDRSAANGSAFECCPQTGGKRLNAHEWGNGDTIKTQFSGFKQAALSQTLQTHPLQEHDAPQARGRCRWPTSRLQRRRSSEQRKPAWDLKSEQARPRPRSQIEHSPSTIVV